MTPSTSTPIAVDAVARPASEAADIVQRLKLVSFCTENIYYPPVAATAAEAADTIQALREIADAARAVLAFRVNEPCRGDLRDTDKSRDALSVLDYAVAAYDSAMKG